MLTSQELAYALLVPALIAAAVAAIGWWRRWPWAMPLAVGAGFLAGYALLRLPTFPPRDGVDWLFWLTIPLSLIGVAASTIPRTDHTDSRRTSWTSALPGLAAGLVALVIISPLTRVGAVSVAATAWTSVVVALLGVALVLAISFAIDRVGTSAVVTCLCITVAGAGVIVMSSNLRIVGIYGLAAAAATGAVALFCRDPRGTRGLAAVVIPIVAALLTAGRFYPDPGVTWPDFALIFAAPLIVAVVALIPMKRKWLSPLTAALATAAFIGALTLPKALAAKKAAEEDPYGAMYQ